MILELKHINHTLQSLNSSIKVMHLLENQENNQNILQDCKILTHRRSLSVPAIIRKNFSGTSPDQKART